MDSMTEIAGDRDAALERLLVDGVERRLHAALEHAVTGLAITELDGGFVQVNPAYCRITGYAADELARMDVLSIVHPEHRAEHRAQLARMLAGEIPTFVIEERYRRKDESDIWVRKSVSILPGLERRRARRVNLVEDIDASRKAEEERARLYLAERAARRAAEAAEARLASVFRQAPAFICVLRGPDHFVEMANDAFYQLVGFRDLVGRPLLEALPEAREQGFLEVLDRVLETREPFVGTEVPITVQPSPHAAPVERVVTFVYQPLMEADGSCSGVFVHGVDMTEQVHARRELESVRLEADEARHRAEEANMARSQFLTMMSHELRTPLNAIGGYAQLLVLGVRGPVTRDQQADLARIQAAQQHLLGLINSVLNFAKLEAGRVHYQMADVPLVACLEDVETLVAPQMRERGLDYTLRAHPGLPIDSRKIEVRADEEKLRQIMVNLLTNATKFTHRGGSVTVTFSVLTGAAEDGREDADMVAVTVADTGIGIAAGRLESIFEPFVQVNRRLSSPDEGVGLGLAISRDLARAMNGDLVVESELGVGSSFTLLLPRAGG
jgi:PAS domain S-box-containing protein